MSHSRINTALPRISLASAVFKLFSTRIIKTLKKFRYSKSPPIAVFDSEVVVQKITTEVEWLHFALYKLDACRKEHNYMVFDPGLIMSRFSSEEFEISDLKRKSDKEESYDKELKSEWSKPKEMTTVRDRLTGIARRPRISHPNACCGNKPFSYDGEFHCCAGKIFKVAREGCCFGKIYDLSSERCEQNRLEKYSKSARSP